MAVRTNFAGQDTKLLDGNLNEITIPEVISTLIIGTASQGPSDTLYPVTSKTDALNLFGSDGTLIQGMYEASAAGAPLTLLWRIGGTQTIIEGIGGGITGYLKERKVDIEDEYFLEWKVTEGGSTADTTKTLKVWRDDGTLVYSAEVIDGELVVDTDLNGEFTAAVVDTITDEDTYNIVNDDPDINGVMVSEIDTEGVDITVATDGLNPTRKELYELLSEAYKLLENYTLHFIHPMDVYLDDANIADGGTGDYLGYLKVDEDSDGATTYTWADTLVDDTYHEVNFAYQLAEFCRGMTENELMVHGTIGVKPPTDITMASIIKWVGKLPTYSATDGSITANGKGLLGNKFMAGKTDFVPGFWGTESGWLDDGNTLKDTNGVDEDIGKFISVVIDYPNLLNRYAVALGLGSSYTTSMACSYAGWLSSLSPEVAPYNQAFPSNMSLLYVIGNSKLNDLSGLHYIVTRFIRGEYKVVDGPTAARNTSDYRFFTTFNIIKYSDTKIRRIASKYLGKGMTLIKRAALKAELDSAFKDDITAGIVQRFNFQITATPLQAVNGQLYIIADIVPAFELRRITNVISVKIQ